VGIGATTKRRSGRVNRLATPVIAVALGTIGVVVSKLTSLAVGVPVEYLLTDTSDAVAEFGCDGRTCMLAGGLTNVGVLLWALAAVTASFVAKVRPRSPARLPLLAGGSFSALLLADDLFRLHDTKLQGSSLVETLITASYIGFAALLVGTFREWLKSTDWLLLGSALGMLAVSAAIDRVASILGINVETGIGVLAEDGAKFVGIVCWACYWAGSAAAALRSE